MVLTKYYLAVESSFRLFKPGKSCILFSASSFSFALASSWGFVEDNVEFPASPITDSAGVFDFSDCIFRLLPSEFFLLFLRDLRGVPSPSTFISFFVFAVNGFLSFSVLFWSCKCCIQHAPSSHLTKISNKRKRNITNSFWTNIIFSFSTK